MNCHPNVTGIYVKGLIYLFHCKLQLYRKVHLKRDKNTARQTFEQAVTKNDPTQTSDSYN